MSVKNKNTEEKWLLPFCIIEDATTGNEGTLSYYYHYALLSVWQLIR